MAYKMEADAGMVSAAELARRKRELELRQLAAQQQQASRTNTINKAAQPAVPAPVAPAPAATPAPAQVQAPAPQPATYNAPTAPTAGQFNAPVRSAIDRFVQTGYMPGQQVTDAYAAYESQKAQQPAAYSSPYDAQIASAFESLMGRGKFQYDLNGDTLYQQMKDRYIQQGNMAMQDSMGQAAALTGGYGNSYAQSVGQQVYNQHLSALNDNIPALRDRAYQEWSAEGDDLLRRLSAAQGMDDRSYGRYRDGVSDWRDMLGMARDDYQQERNFDRGVYESDRGYARNAYESDRAFDENLFNQDRAFAYDQFVNDRNFDRSTFESDRDFGYGQFYDDRNFEYGVSQDEQSRMDAEKEAARQTALKIASQLLETGRMPDQATLDAAGISVADAQQLAAAYTPVPTSGGGGRAAKPENTSLKAENYNALRDAYVNGGDAAIERLAFDLEAQGVPPAALLNGMDVIKRGYQANSSPTAKTKQAVEGISSTLQTAGEGILAALPFAGLGMTALDVLKNLGKK